MSLEESEIFKLFLDYDQRTPDRVRNAIKAGWRVDVKGGLGETLLHVLTLPLRQESDLPPIVSTIYLLGAFKIDPLAQDCEGNTALHCALLRNCHPDLVNALLKIGSDPSLTNKAGVSSLDIANDSEGSVVLRILVRHWYPGVWRTVEDGDEKKLRVLADSWCKLSLKRGNIKLVEFMVERNMSADIIQYVRQVKRTNSVVHYALAGCTGKVRALLRKGGVDINTKDRSKIQEDGTHAPWPLLAAVTDLERYNVANLLVKKGADVNVQLQVTKECSQPLFYNLLINHGGAYRQGMFNNLATKGQLQQILESPDDVLFSAVLCAMPDKFVSRLLRLNLRCLTERDGDGRTARDRLLLHTYHLDVTLRRRKLYDLDKHVIKMAGEGQITKLEMLLQNGYDSLIVFNLTGQSTVDIASANDQKKVVNFLEKLSHLHEKNGCLDEAVKRGDLNTIRDELNKETAKLKDRCGRTVLHKAVLYEQHPIVAYVLKHFAEIKDEQDMLGRTAMHYACASRKERGMLKLLKSFKASDVILDNIGRSPYEFNDEIYWDYLEEERSKDYGKCVFVLDIYMQMIDCLILSNMACFLHQLARCYTIPLSLMDHLPIWFPGLVYKPIAFLCAERCETEMAIELVKAASRHGEQNYMLAAKFESETLVEVAERNNLQDLKSCLLGLVAKKK